MGMACAISAAMAFPYASLDPCLLRARVSLVACPQQPQRRGSQKPQTARGQNRGGCPSIACCDRTYCRNRGPIRRSSHSSRSVQRHRSQTNNNHLLDVRIAELCRKLDRQPGHLLLRASRNRLDYVVPAKSHQLLSRPCCEHLFLVPHLLVRPSNDLPIWHSIQRRDAHDPGNLCFGQAEP